VGLGKQQGCLASSVSGSGEEWENMLSRPDFAAAIWSRREGRSTALRTARCSQVEWDTRVRSLLEPQRVMFLDRK
jgi:hypothetical protein